MSTFAVVGSSGLVGQEVVAELGRRGHVSVEISRSRGVDVETGDGLNSALEGVTGVVDVLNTPDLEPEKAVSFFERTTRTLLAAEGEAGIEHHVLLSIVKVDAVEGNGHYAGKRAQEDLVRAGKVPWTIQRATQFFDFAAMVAGWTTEDGLATVAPLLLRPVAVADVAAALVDHLESGPGGDADDLAGPTTEDFVDMARRTLEARGDSTAIRASWRDGPFGVDMAGEVLLPADGARIGDTTFEEWLSTQQSSPGTAS